VIEHTPGASISPRTYPAPPGWQDVVTWNLAEICAWSWDQHVRYATEFFEHASVPVVHASYEAFVQSPASLLSRLAHELDRRWNDRVEQHTADPPLSRTTVSPPAEDEWRRYEAEILSAPPILGETARRVGDETGSR
jgi:hypothetical protein